jgi:hypothetical protein
VNTKENDEKYQKLHNQKHTKKKPNLYIFKENSN